MPMKIVPETTAHKIAIIDPNKQFGENGQYVSHEGIYADLEVKAAKARCSGKEIRWYYKDLSTANGEQIASQIIVTEIPAGHVQPFHTHRTIHEMTLVMHGEIVAIDDDFLDEDSPVEELLRNGLRVPAGHMVIEGPGTRHTIMNSGDDYARLVTVQSARISLEGFPHDWHRDSLS